MDSDEKGLIRQGHQRVLTARFRDAEFFWNADQKIAPARPACRCSIRLRTRQSLEAMAIRLGV